MKAAVKALVLFVGLSTGAAAQADFTGRILASHNAERAALDLPTLVWSETLAAEAAVWADRLAELGRLEHSPGYQRPGDGENLWMGTADAFTLEEMVGDWAEEKRLFRYGVFPDVSTSGNWHEVGHYTQMIWKHTSEVGCALASRDGWDVLVCRYSPAGNIVGERPY
jgi:hypothetical protein